MGTKTSAQLTSKGFCEDQLKKIMIAPNYQDVPGNFARYFPYMLLFNPPEFPKLSLKELKKPDQLKK